MRACISGNATRAESPPQEGDRWVTRLRTSKTGDNGTNPEVRADGLRPRTTHVVVTYDGAVERIYLNGREAVSSKKVAGSIEGWAEDFPLVVGNEYKDSRDWAGTVRFVAFYSRALPAGEVGRLSKQLPPGVKLPPPAEPGEDDFF